LKGDAPKAIFFYRGYLRNAPKAPNRAEIEARIAALQKEANEKPTPATPVAPPPPPVTPAPAPHAPPSPPSPPPGPTPVAPPPVTAPPLTGAVPEAPVPAPMTEPEAPPSEPEQNRPIDVALGLGFAKWNSGFKIKETDPAQFVWALGAGYTLGDVYGGVSFRIGAMIEHTSQDEGSGLTKNTLSFTSLLVEPSVRIR